MQNLVNILRGKKVIKVPESRRSPVIDGCAVQINLPKLSVEIPATFHCYHALERCFNDAYGFVSVEKSKPLAWFVNQYLKNSCELPSEVIISVVNLFFERFVEINYRVSVGDFRDKADLQVLTDLMIMLCGYCIGGSAEGKKLYRSLIEAIRKGKRVRVEITSPRNSSKKTSSTSQDSSILH